MEPVVPLQSSEPITAPGTGIANLPNQRHKIVAKNGANFTLMVCGMFVFLYKVSFYSCLICRREWFGQDDLCEHVVYDDD